MNHPYIFRGVILALLSFLLAGCQKGSSGEVAAASNPAAHNPMEITISDDLFSQIKIGEPRWSEVAERCAWRAAWKRMKTAWRG